MPKYLVKAPTWLSHAGRQLKEGDTVDIDWPPGTEPKQLGDNLELLAEARKGGKAKGADKDSDGNGDALA